MKHLNVLTAERPAVAAEFAPIQLKDLIADNLGIGAKGDFRLPLGNMEADEVRWLTAQWDNWMQK